MRVRSLAAILSLVSAGAIAARAATAVWTFDAGLGRIQAFELETGNAVADFVAPHKDADPAKLNGRGIALVGTSIYYTLAGSPNVYKTDTVTHADLGIAFTTPLTAGINSLSWDGASFWMVAAEPTDQTKPVDENVYQFSPTGKLLQTIKLPRPANTNLACDGIAVTGYGIVANRGSVPYDIYDFSGKLRKAAFITAPFRTKGIAFDGIGYIVSDVMNARLAIFDATGKFVRFVTLRADNMPLGIMGVALSPAPVVASAELR